MSGGRPHRLLSQESTWAWLKKGERWADESDTGDDLGKESSFGDSSFDTDAGDELFDPVTGLRIYDTKLDGADAKRCEWKVDDFSKKLCAAWPYGRAVISPSFELWGMEAKIMIAPQQQESNTGSRSHKAKEQISRMATKGPCEACLQLKVFQPVGLQYQLRVGDKASVVYQHDFAKSSDSKHGVFKDADGSSVDWVSEIKESSIIIGVEMRRPVPSLVLSPVRQCNSDFEDEEDMSPLRGDFWRANFPHRFEGEDLSPLSEDVVEHHDGREHIQNKDMVYQ